MKILSITGKYKERMEIIPSISLHWTDLKNYIMYDLTFSWLLWYANVTIFLHRDKKGE